MAVPVTPASCHAIWKTLGDTRSPSGTVPSHFLGEHMQSEPTSEAVIAYLDGLPLVLSLWWFIENATQETR